jgi:glycosyltransferase involved in cell wall biosynthesis
MRVCVVEASGKGGMIHYDYHLCRALQRAGVDTTLVTSTAYELRDLPHEFKVVELLHLWDPRGGKGGNPIWRKIRRGVRGAQYMAEWLRLVWYLRRTHPDVVLFGEIRFAFEEYFLRMLRGLHLADVVHDVQAYDTRRGSESILQESEAHYQRFNRIYSLFSALFVHDRSNYDQFLKLYSIPAEHVHEIPLATNEIVLEVPQVKTPDELRRDLGIASGQQVVTFFGTITKYKGLEDLIKGFPAVHQATGARLVVAGFPAKDVDPVALKALASEVGIQDQIAWFLDYVPNEWVATLMAISDVIVLPYRAITQSAVIQIAYACGRPVVATRIGGLPDVVEEGQSGLLAPPEDPAGLADALNRILCDSAQLERMGQRAKELADTRYSWRVVAEKMKAVFETLPKKVYSPSPQGGEGAGG